LENKGQHGHHCRKHHPQQCSFQHHSAAQFQMIALQKQDDFESFPIERSESEQNQSKPEALLRNLSAARIFE
jgi:hypothetical protein